MRMCATARRKSPGDSARKYFANLGKALSGRRIRRRRNAPANGCSIWMPMKSSPRNWQRRFARWSASQMGRRRRMSFRGAPITADAGFDTAIGILTGSCACIARDRPIGSAKSRTRVSRSGAGWVACARTCCILATKASPRQIAKIAPYHSDFVKRRLAAGKSSGFFEFAVRPPWRFLRAYFLRLGFLDGWPGFYIAALSAFSTLTRNAMVSEAKLPKPTAP